MSEERPFEEEDAAEDAPAIPNAAETEHNRRIRRAVKEEDDERSIFWKALFESEIGRREMWQILDWSGAFHQRFAFRREVAHDMATWFDAGSQSFGFRLYLHWMKLCPEGVMKMMIENHPDLKAPEKPPQRRLKQQDMPEWPIFP